MAENESVESAPVILSSDNSVSGAMGAIEALLKRPGGTSDPTDPDNEIPAQAEPAQEAAEEEAPELEAAEPAEEPEAAKPPTVKADSSTELAQRMEAATRATADAEAVKNQFTQALNTIVPQLENQLRGEFSDLKTRADVLQLMQTDPARYNQFVVKSEELRYAQQVQQQAQAETEKANLAMFQKWQQGELEKLGGLIPELKDPAKGTETANKIQQYAKSLGYSPQQLALASANDFKILYNAMQFQDLQKAQEAAQKKAAKAPPVQKPGVARSPASKDDRITTDFNRLQKSGSVGDAAAVFRHIISG